MGRDIYDIFNECVDKSKEVEDDDIFYDLGAFSKYLVEECQHGNDYRIISMLHLLIRDLAIENDKSIPELILDILNIDTRYTGLIAIRGNDIELIGDLPSNINITLSSKGDDI